LLAVGACGSVVFQLAGVVSGQGNGGWRTRLRQAVFVWMVFWGATSMFLCLLILAASLHARWDVPGVYYWMAAFAGGMALALLGAAGLFADGAQSEGGRGQRG
jgi:hypothetical protein